MTPFEALQEAIHIVHGKLRGHGPHCRPGEAVDYCSPSVREGLRQLKSDDIVDVRLAPWMHQ